MKKTLFALGLLLILLTACSQIPTASKNGLEIAKLQVLLPDAHSAMAGMNADLTAVAYMQIKNHSGEADRLIGVSSDFGDATLHETKIEGDVITMNALSGLDLPANGQIELRPGSYHIMVMNLKEESKPGQPVNLTLEFAQAGPITVTTRLASQ